MRGNDYRKAKTMIVDWDSRCLLSERCTRDEAAAAATVCEGEEGIYEEVDPEVCQISEYTYQPLIHSRLLEVEAGVGAMEDAHPYQDLTHDD